MNSFSGSLIAKVNSPARSLVERIQSTYGFVIDAGGKVQQQWLATCDQVYFRQWFSDALKLGTIRLVAAKLPQQHAKHLRITCGMPTKDFPFVTVANAAQPHYVVSEDIDFWEPTYKQCDEETKARTKANRQGCVCRYLKRIGVTVGTVNQASGDLFAPAIGLSCAT